MRKKSFLIILMICMVGSLFLAGCGQESGSGSGQTKITYAIWDKNQQPAMEAIAAAFHEKNPGITVEVQLIPWNQYWTKLEASATSDTMPDVFWMHSQSFVRYASNDMLMDLTDKTKGDIDLANYPQDLVKMYTYNGKVYGVPKDYDTVALWYNKTMFDAKGLAYPDETWDWNKLVETAQKLNDPDNGVYGFLAPPDQQSLYYDFRLSEWRRDPECR
ncbi:MAG: extracellular solute-binding protein [Selenomonas sp.]|jgi:multiple sugar transport system substrate-binding protein|nr:extracellular solute-binding protein [Selenomonas sp.]